MILSARRLKKHLPVKILGNLDRYSPAHDAFASLAKIGVDTLQGAYGLARITSVSGLAGFVAGENPFAVLNEHTVLYGDSANGRLNEAIAATLPISFAPNAERLIVSGGYRNPDYCSAIGQDLEQKLT